MLVLKFDSKLFTDDLLKAIADGAHEAMEYFLKMAQNNLRAKDAELEDTVIDMASEKITTTCIFYAQSILESYGRGEQMDEFNPYLKEYFRNIALGWNPARKDKRIVGRKKGYYINFLGEQAYSTGKMEGRVTSRYVGHVVQPARAIQNAEKRLEEASKNGGFIMRALDRHVEEFFSKMDSSKYFYNEDI